MHTFPGTGTDERGYTYIWTQSSRYRTNERGYIPMDTVFQVKVLMKEDTYIWTQSSRYRY